MRLLTWALSAAAIVALAGAPAGAVPIFTLQPASGALSGLPGQTLGWGLSIQNDTSGWLVITSTTYDQTQSIGDFTDFLTSQFLLYALPPNQTWTQAFDPIAPAGLGSYTIGDFALPGDTAVGSLNLLFEIHGIDPNGPDYNPLYDMIMGTQALLPATVTYQTGPEVPEPATIATVVAGLALLAVKRRR